MIKIITCSENSHLVKELSELLHSQWDKIDPMFAVSLPSPLVAMDERDRLSGGLVFTFAPEPNGSNPAVWVNAVIVKPEQRGRGIASTLVRAAKSHAAQEQNIDRLYVYTDVIDLYRKTGWSIVQQDGSNAVLTTVASS